MLLRGVPREHPHDDIVTFRECHVLVREVVVGWMNAVAMMSPTRRPSINRKNPSAASSAYRANARPSIERGGGGS